MGMGGKAGAAATKALQGADSSTTTTSSTMASPGEAKSGGGGEDNGKGSSDGGTGGGDQMPKAGSKGGTEDLLHEATQLLKTLRGPMTPKLKVMQLSNVDTVDEERILLDSGATHALRPAQDEGEWMAAERTSEQLADGTTEMFRLKKNTKVLLAAPNTQVSWIIPMSGLSDLDFSLEWRDGLFKLKDDEGREVPVELRNGCPMISRQEGEKIMQWLELFYVHQWRKLAVVKTLLADANMVDLNLLNLETAMTVKMKQEFPGLPDHIMMKLIPYLEMVKAEDFGARLPWNRHKRRRLLKAKKIILHIFSGPDSSYWEKQCGSADTEVLCVDTEGSQPANLHDKNVYGFLAALCASGRVKAIIGGPPCRTVSALRYQGDEGPGVVRNDEHPYGLPDLPPKDAALVEGDTILMFRFLSLMTLCEDVRPADDEVPTAFLMEQPEDPANYRDEADVQQHRYFSMFRTQEWQDFQTRYGLSQFSFDQCTMGHTKRKPTTIGTNLMELAQLDELRGQPEGEAQAAEQFRALPMEQRFQATKSWAAWAPGLKAAIAAGLNRYLRGAGRGLDSVQPQASGSAGASEGDLSSVQPRALRTISQLALESWKTHFLNDHLPARRDCAHCVRAQARSRPHRRVTHPEAYTLSVDLSGKMTSGVDQEHQRARYLMVACYTFPVTADGRPLVDPPGAPKDDQDQPLPSMDLHGGEDPTSHVADQPLPSMDLYGGGGLSSNAGQPSPSMDLYGGEDRGNNAQVPHDGVFDDDEVMMDDGGDLPPRPESSEGLADPADPLAEEPVPPAGPDGPHEEALRGAHNVWHRLVEDATNVAVRNLTFVELVNSRSVKEVLPALARIHAKLQSLGLPLVRLHCDRARELVSAPIRQWTLDRGIITTLTSGSSYRSNGRVEAEVGNTKRAIKTILTANQCPLECWPLCARHIGERRLRCQLQKLGFPTGPMLRFGSKVYALRKSWQERYTHWRDAREEVQIMGPDKFTSLTTTSYYVKSLKTGRFFYTDDVVQIPPDAPLELPGDSHDIYVEERGERSSMPQWPGVPTRRLRGKTAVPAIRSMVNIEGEAWGLNANDPTKDAVLTGVPHQVFQIPEYLKSHLEGDEIGSSGGSSWSLGTDSEQTTASPIASTPTLQSDEEEVGGGEWGEAPNNRDGGSSPVASTTSGVAAIRAFHANVVDYIRDEMNRLDATTEDQALWIGSITEAISLRALLENQLQQFQHEAIKEDHEKLDQEFLVTRTISNAEVWSHLEDWKPSICAEYEQLLHKKQAVKQITRSQLQDLAKQRGLPIELLPGKMVHTRKAGSGAFRSRAVVCGNYQDPGNEEVYAGGADGNQIRAQIRIASSKSWSIYGTDIRVAFLNAPRRDETKITAMEVPTVFRKLGLATQNDVWVIEKALYGLVGSPRDWCLYRDETLPTVAWTRLRHGREVKGSFKKTADENVWRLIEVDVESGENHWSGIMTVYVDDLLVSAEDEAAKAALASIAKIWATSDIEKVEEGGKPLKYCGFEIEAGPQGDGFLISQRMYEKEMVQKWGIEKEIDAPHFRPSEDDENPGEPVQATDIKVAQGMAGALLWLTTRTRPDLAMSVSTVCRLATKNPKRAIEILSGKQTC